MSAFRFRFLQAARRGVASEVVSARGRAVSLSVECVERLRAMAKERAAASLALRVEVDSGGCSGFSYKFRIENEARSAEGDLLVEQDGARVLIDDISLPFVRGATIDYKEELIRSGFVIDENPNSDASCSCGSSFAPKGG